MTFTRDGHRAPRSREVLPRTDSRGERGYTARLVMPKMKSHSGAKKRFKKTATGKLQGRHAFSSHILEKKSPKRKREMGLDREISKADRKTVTKLLGGNGR
jgi:large subunit ribosomal protein L35